MLLSLYMYFIYFKYCSTVQRHNYLHLSFIRHIQMPLRRTTVVTLSMRPYRLPASANDPVKTYSTRRMIRHPATISRSRCHNSPIYRRCLRWRTASSKHETDSASHSQPCWTILFCARSWTQRRAPARTSSKSWCEEWRDSLCLPRLRTASNG